MTPKEKAIQLVDKFIQANGNSFCAKQCALIAVDEILEQLNHLPTQGYGLECRDIIEYFEQVKTEIEKL